MVTVDAKGLFCPEPLMMTQDALKKNPGEQVVVEVDSATPRDNILRLARRKKLNATVDEKDGVFTIAIGSRFVALFAPISALFPRKFWSGLFYVNENGLRSSVLQCVCRFGRTVGAFPQGGFATGVADVLTVAWAELTALIG